jgi:DNA-binding transcriptional regulator YhcF (GntR family)
MEAPMDEYWATRTGRWRRAMQGVSAPSLAERLYHVIRKDVEAKQLPAGAVLPTSERVASDLAIKTADVQSAYARLLSEGLIEVRGEDRLCIAGNDGDASVGDATQIRFEAALLKAVREAAARGLSSTEATGMFKAALSRVQDMERPPKPKE